jgi:hypothetical protein
MSVMNIEPGLCVMTRGRPALATARPEVTPQAQKQGTSPSGTSMGSP